MLIMQYVLMAVVALGMLVVIIISARNYSPTEWIILAFFIIIIAIVGINYFFGTNVAATLTNLMTKPQVKLDIVQQKEAENTETKDSSLFARNEVFHVTGQYNYTQAKALCRAYGGSLANIKQMEEAHKNGAEWCNYGWSDDQMALFPTQEKTWEKFKKTESNQKDCGRPGVNGGYTMDLNQLLGVNCFGRKPAQNANKIQAAPFPKDPLDEQVNQYKNNLPDTSLTAFNYSKWKQ
jgi:hypothetical protein